MARRPANPRRTPSRRRRDDDSVVVEQSERGRWVGGIHFSGFSLMMMALLVLGVVVLAPNLKALVEQRQQIADLRQHVAQQKDDVEDMRRERERWDDPTYVQTQARERFFYVSPGEISFIVINDLDKTFLSDTTDPISDELTTTNVDWASSMLTSIMTAAFTPVEGDETSKKPSSTPTPTPTETSTEKK
ncbi:FtsB family cell division protein [Paramicrobacterium chengjingii]|uniref:Septum formation initiator family protein n=1 Tax=Paramicrobacterium chengjingii TaxID=2769067 RepID=A0ABX6YL51_9MICO|nr:septum formation initiator family protein [Microbacterium chengjingii]QPZ39517.1 septum formation initiator family protein [Microbacterium chengjingii]